MPEATVEQQLVPLSQGFATLFDRIEREMKKAYAETVDVELRAIANGFRQDLISGVEQGRYDLAPLSTRWLRKKKKHGLDLRILIASHEALRNIRVRQWARSEGDGFTVEPTRERVKPYKFQKHSKLTYFDLFDIHENGKGNNPARPVWGITYMRTQAKMDQLISGLERAFARRCERKLKRLMRS